MHVLLIPSWYPLDAGDLNGSFFREQAQALERAGHRVGVVAPMFRSLRGGAAALRGGFGDSFWQDGGIPTFRAHGVFTSSKLPHFDLWRWCRRGEALFHRYVAQFGRPDLIHAHSLLLGGVLAHRIAAQTGIPFGVTEHSTTFARGLVQDWQIGGLRRAAEAARFRLAVSEPLVHRIRGRIGGPDWDVLPNMLDPLFEAPPAADRPAVPPVRLISVAHLVPKKGYDLLLTALAEARARAPQLDLRLSIGGDGSERAALEAQAAALGLGGVVTFLGKLPRPAVRDALRRADAFVLASRHETFGIVFIEALSQGLPVIATRSGGPEGIVTPEDGILVPTNDVAALSAGLCSLAERLGGFDRAAIRSRALDRFSERNVIARLQDIYEKIAAKQRG